MPACKPTRNSATPESQICLVADYRADQLDLEDFAEATRLFLRGGRSASISPGQLTLTADVRCSNRRLGRVAFETRRRQKTTATKPANTVEGSGIAKLSKDSTENISLVGS